MNEKQKKLAVGLEAIRDELGSNFVTTLLNRNAKILNLLVELGVPVKVKIRRRFFMSREGNPQFEGSTTFQLPDELWEVAKEFDIRQNLFLVSDPEDSMVMTPKAKLYHTFEVEEIFE